jgi:hypothetical protein
VISIRRWIRERAERFSGGEAIGCVLRVAEWNTRRHRERSAVFESFYGEQLTGPVTDDSEADCISQLVSNARPATEATTRMTGNASANDHEAAASSPVELKPPMSRFV